MPKKAQKRVVMARRVARRWVTGLAAPEYRLRILYGMTEIRQLPNLMRSFRDGRIAMEGVDLGSLPDLGVKENFDSLEIWTRNREALSKMQAWFEDRGFETSGVW